MKTVLLRAWRWARAVASVVVVLSAVVVLAFNALPDPKPENPLAYKIPQVVLSQGPYRPGDTLITRAEKCNTADYAVSVLGSSDYRRLDAAGALPGTRGSIPLVIGPGECLDRTFQTVLPADLVPGTWRRQGQDCVMPEAVVCRPWYTEPFEVVR